MVSDGLRFHQYDIPIPENKLPKALKQPENHNILQCLMKKSAAVVGLCGLYNQLDEAINAYTRMITRQKQYGIPEKGRLLVRTHDQYRREAMCRIFMATHENLLHCTILDWESMRGHPMWKSDRYRILVWDAIGAWFATNKVDISGGWPWIERFTSNMNRDRGDLFMIPDVKLNYIIAANDAGNPGTTMTMHNMYDIDFEVDLTRRHLFNLRGFHVNLDEPGNINTADNYQQVMDYWRSTGDKLSNTYEVTRPCRSTLQLMLQAKSADDIDVPSTAEDVIRHMEFVTMWRRKLNSDDSDDEISVSSAYTTSAVTGKPLISAVVGASKVSLKSNVNTPAFQERMADLVKRCPATTTDGEHHTPEADPYDNSGIHSTTTGGVHGTKEII